MRAALAGVLLAALAAPGAPARADQRAPELDALFAELRAAPGAAQAAAVEARIWALWSDSGDARVDALLARGVDAMQAGDLDAAIETFTRVVGLAPGFAEGWNKRATAYYLRREFPASVSDIERTLALEPRHFGAVSGMGLIFLERGDLVGALGAFERVLEIHPASPGARAQVRELRRRLAGRAA